MPSSDNPLDNPVYHSLLTNHARFAQSHGVALRFDPEVAPFAGLPDEAPGTYDELAQMLAPGELTVIALPHEPQLPPGWEVLRRLIGYQMICLRPVLGPGLSPIPSPIPVPADPLIPLTESDVPEMLELTALTDPGPFRRRTIELGSYLGIRPENDPAGRLAAMAGERMALSGHTEVSAVCTHPDFRGRGYAQALIAAVAAGIQARGEIPILHVVSTNPAIRVYERLGFTIRTTMHFTVVLPPQP
jgi:GNAT superfamily N-acetyltransferase